MATQVDRTAFLDVDGVIIATASPRHPITVALLPRPVTHRELTMHVDGEDATLYYRADVVELLVEIAAMPDGPELVWLTSWGRWDHDELGPAIGLPNIPLAVGAPEEPGGAGHPLFGSASVTWRKAQIVVDYLRNGASGLWVDDSITPDLAERLSAMALDLRLLVSIGQHGPSHGDP